MEGKVNYNQVWKIVNAAIVAHGILASHKHDPAQNLDVILEVCGILNDVVGPDAPKLYIESEEK